jgi:hypothetical protein
MEANQAGPWIVVEASRRRWLGLRVVVIDCGEDGGWSGGGGLLDLVLSGLRQARGRAEGLVERAIERLAEGES